MPLFPRCSLPTCTTWLALVALVPTSARHVIPWFEYFPVSALFLVTPSYQVVGTMAFLPITTVDLGVLFA